MAKGDSLFKMRQMAGFVNFRQGMCAASNDNFHWGLPVRTSVGYSDKTVSLQSLLGSEIQSATVRDKILVSPVDVK